MKQAIQKSFKKSVDLNSTVPVIQSLHVEWIDPIAYLFRFMLKLMRESHLISLFEMNEVRRQHSVVKHPSGMYLFLLVTQFCHSVCSPSETKFKIRYFFFSLTKVPVYHPICTFYVFIGRHYIVEWYLFPWLFWEWCTLFSPRRDSWYRVVKRLTLVSFLLLTA